MAMTLYVTSVAPAIVWKISHSGCDLKSCDFIARIWASPQDSGTYTNVYAPTVTVNIEML